MSASPPASRARSASPLARSSRSLRNNDVPQSGRTVKIIIRMAGGDVDYVTNDIERTTLADLSDTVRSNKGGITLNHRLRFVHNGIALTSNTNIARDVVGTRSRVFVHCLVGGILSREDIARNDLDYDPSLDQSNGQIPIAELRGFDRLRAAGFSDEDINSIREQFGQFHEIDEINAADQQALEEQWIDTPAQVLQRGPFGTGYIAGVLSVLLGAFLGANVIVLLKLSIFSRSQKRAVVLGLVLNMALTLLQQLA